MDENCFILKLSEYERGFTKNTFHDYFSADVERGMVKNYFNKK